MTDELISSPVPVPNALAPDTLELIKTLTTALEQSAPRLKLVMGAADGAVGSSREPVVVIAGFHAKFEGQGPQMVAVVGERITADDLRRISMAEVERWGRDRAPKRFDPGALPALTRDGKTSDEFAELFVKHYQAWSERDAHPINRMASEYGLNRRTLHSWLRECRLRGLLPQPTRKS